MFLIAGLGNPGRQYEKTRHNMGFDTIDELIERHRIPQGGIAHKAMYGKGMIAGEKVLAVKPLTYMNLSGEAIREYVNYYKMNPETELIVIYDDIDLDPGQIRIRKKGSAGGHNGIKSIIAQIGTQNFYRIKVGVGAKPKGWDLADYVLGRFSPEERELVDKAICDAADAVEMILKDGIEAAMNHYNGAAKKKKVTENKQE